MKFNINHLWYIFFRTWEVGKRNIELKYFFHKQKNRHHCDMGTKRMRMNFIGLNEKFITEATREVIACTKESTIIQQVSKVNFHIGLEVRQPLTYNIQCH